VDCGDIHEYLAYAVKVEASDLHLGPDSQPMVRHHGLLMPIDPEAPRLVPEQTEALARQFLTPEQAGRVEEIGSIDFCYAAEGLARFRASVVRQRRGWECVFRVITSEVRTMEELGFPEVMYDLLKYHNGIVLVTGSVGSGKTTTLAALVREINQERKDHIITLEDPIEYVHQPIGCQITQREIHSHTESFSTALRASLRQDPDVIMVGEMRDLETISLAITAAETGHLVLATLHTSNAARTMQRLLDVFPVEQQAQIRTMVSESMRGVICQQLVPRADGTGRALALEIMVNTPAIGNLIREGKNFMIPGQMQTGRKLGMRLMDDSLMELVKSKVISEQEAYLRAENKKVFGAALAGKI
jgi:twitching motility protein PilT